MGLNGYDHTQQVNSDQGIRTQYGIILPPGARVAAYVRSTGIQSGDDTFLAQNLVTTLAAGLARARSGMGDFVVCLPGHTENVTDGTTFSGALVAGTKILGVGRGGNTPTFTFTAAGSSWVVGVNDVFIGGLRLTVSAAVSTTTAISVTGNDFGFSFNEFVTANGTAVLFNAISVSGAAARYDISNNVFRGVAPAASSQCIVIASTGDSGRIADNEMIVPLFTTAGAINVTAAATNLKILRNVINNITAASIAGISLANVAITGHCAYNTITVLNTGAVVSGTTGITIGAAVTMGFFQNYVVNDPLRSGLLLPTVDT